MLERGDHGQSGIVRRGAPRRCSARAFTLLDVLVSIAVIAILIGLLLPSLKSVNETARRVVCQSNVRQIGLGVLMYADDWRGELPSSVFLGRRQTPQDMLTIRLDADSPLVGNSPWDGLGHLSELSYLTAPKIFYRPSHRGDNPYSRFAPIWNEPTDEIDCNYQFRGEGPAGPDSDRHTHVLYNIDPAQSSLIADGLRIRSDFNHVIGVNFFRADLSVHWYSDRGGTVVNSLPLTKEEARSSMYIEDAWSLFDAAANKPD